MHPEGLLPKMKSQIVLMLLVGRARAAPYTSIISTIGNPCWVSSGQTKERKTLQPGKTIPSGKKIIWVAAQELNFSDQIVEALLFTVYIPIWI